MTRQAQILILAVFFLNIGLLGGANSIFADDKTSASLLAGKSQKLELDASTAPKESLMNTAFVLETNDETAAESLERISGKVDMGFSAPENTYQSEERPGAGPFAKEKAEIKKQSNTSY